jgi:ketosteroid isomerase-like protein
MAQATSQGESARIQSGRPALPDNDLELHQRIDSLAEAIRNKNLDQLMAHYAPDVVAYDVLSPLEVLGNEAYRKNIEKWFASMAGRISYDMMELHVSASDTHAYCYFLSHVTGARTGGGRADYWVRVSSDWRKVDGEWVVAHEHVSVPTLM